MDDVNPLEGTNINPLLADAVISITQGMAEAFEQVWSRDDAHQLVEGFLDGHVVFRIDRQGIDILTTGGRNVTSN